MEANSEYIDSLGLGALTTVKQLSVIHESEDNDGTGGREEDEYGEDELETGLEAIHVASHVINADVESNNS